MIFTTAIEIISYYEKFQAAPYLCPAGQVTIGYGTTKYPDGRPVKLTDPPISKEQAKRYMAAELERLSRVLYKFNPAVITWPANKQAILLSKMFNMGVGAAFKTSLFKEIKSAGVLYVPAGSQIANSGITSNGLILKGLQRRRYAESLVYQGVPFVAAIKEAELKF